MKTKRFAIGGIHLNKHKFSSRIEIEELSLPDKVYIPVKQHIGAPAKIVVAAGDKVKVGTLLAEADGVFSANVSSSVSGEVLKIEEINNGLGYPETVITIRREGDEFEPFMDMSPDIVREIPEDKAVLQQAIHRAGVVGMGGAGFPTPIKTTVPEGKKADILIINGIECEPYLTADSRLMEEKAEQIVIGARILNKILGIQNAVIAIDENKPRAIEILSKITKSYIGVNVQVCQSIYPMGGEKQLINAIVGKEVPSGKLPIDVGCVVQNVGTVYAVYEAVQKHIPLFRRVLTVSGDIDWNPCNYLVRIGTPVSFVLEANQVNIDKVGKVLMGGPMMGTAITSLDAPVTKTTSGITVLAEKTSLKPEPTACIRCAKCVDACPMGLMPFAIRQAVEDDEMGELKKLHVTDCIGCGCCAYACPAKIPLLDYCKLGKFELSKNAKKD